MKYRPFALFILLLFCSYHSGLGKNKDSVNVREAKRISAISTLLPNNGIKTKTGDQETDNIFANYTIDQIQIIVDEYSKKLTKAEKQKKELIETSLNLGEKFINVFSESKVIDEVAMRYADLLYDKISEEYYAKKSIYDKELTLFLNSSEYKDYQKRLEQYYLTDTLGIGTPPKKPKGPEPPDPKLDKLLSIYDKVINDMPESPYVADAIYGKAYLLGERYIDYLPLLEIKYDGDDRKALNDVETKRNESMSLLQQLTRRYPDSRYTVDAYMLIGEYLFNTKKNQPRKTREAIPYYKKALELISKRGQRSEYYYQAMYKLAWSYYRLGLEDANEYNEAIVHFTQLIDDIEKAEEVYLGKKLPKYIRPDMKNEAMDIMVTCFLQLQKIENTSTVKQYGSDTTGVARIDKYFGSSKTPRRYAPLIYEKLAEQYTELKENPFKINAIYFALLNRYPKYERAPRIAQRVIEQYKLVTENGELIGDAKEKGLEILYDQRNKLFYDYGRNSDWFKSIRRRIEAQRKGKILPFDEQSVFTSGFDVSILGYTDSISKEALFQNIIYSSSRAQVLEEGREATEFSEAVKKDTSRAKLLYQKTVDDIAQYTKLFSKYDSIAYLTLFQRAIILEDKLKKVDEALETYMSIAKNFAWDEMPYPLKEDSLISYRKFAIGRAFEITNAVCEAKKIGFSDPTIDTASRPSSMPPLPILDDEKKFIDVVDTYIRLYPHDTVSAFAILKLANFYRSKGYTDKYKEVNSRLVLYYPIQPIYPSTIIPLMYAAYETGDFSRSEQMAKALYYGPKSGNAKLDSLYKQEGYRYVGASINERAKLYEGKQNFFAAAREYERAARSVPEWEYVDEALLKAAETYDSAKATNEAVRVYNFVIDNARQKKNVVKGYTGIVNSYKLAGKYDSVSTALERIADVYSNPKTDTTGVNAVYPRKKDGESFAENALFQSLTASERVSEESNNWDNSIRLSNKYLERYPNSEKAPKVALNRIDQFRKSGNMKGVEDAYGQFADNYKDDPLSVYAYFRRGEMREAENDTANALVEFEKVIKRHNELSKQKKSNGSTQIYSSESLYKLKNKVFSDYISIPISMVIMEKAFEEKQVENPTTNTEQQSKTKGKQPVAKKPEPKSSVDTSKALRYETRMKEQKKKYLDSLLVELVKSSTYRTIDAFYIDAVANEEIANRYFRLPDTLDKVRNRDGKRIPNGIPKASVVSQANNDASASFGRAGVSYVTTIKRMKGYADEFGKIIEKDTLEVSDKKVYADIIAFSDTLLNKNSNEEIYQKLNTKITKWISDEGRNPPDTAFIAAINFNLSNARKKVSEMYYKAADIQAKNAYLFLDIEVPKSIKEYTVKRTIGKGRNKQTIELFVGDVLELTVLAKFVKDYVQPYAEVAIKTHQLGIDRSKDKELGLDPNNEYVKLSEKAIIELASIGVERIDSISRLAVSLFDNIDREYRNRLDSIKNQTGGDARYLALRSAKMSQIIQTFNALVADALDQYSKAYTLLKSAKSADTSRISLKASKFIYDLGAISLQRADTLTSKVKRYNEIANYFDPQTGENKFWYGDAAIQYQPIADLYKAVAQTILQNTVILIDEYQIQNEFTAKALNLLVESDRVKYLRLLGTEAIKDTLISVDNTWLFATQIPDEDTYEWFNNNYLKANSWNSAIVNSEAKTLSVVETKKASGDTLLSYKDIEVASLWYTDKRVLGLPPTFNKIGDNITFRMSFNALNDSILSGVELLDSLAKVISNNPYYIVELTNGNFEIPDRNYERLINKRLETLKRVLINNNVNLAQVKFNSQQTYRFPNLKLIRVSPKSFTDFIEEGAIYVSYITFKPKSAEFDSGIEELDSLSAFLTINPESIVEITVSNDNPKIDIKTGKTLRTQTVKEREEAFILYLISKGVKPSQILRSNVSQSQETTIKLKRYKLPPPYSFEAVNVGESVDFKAIKFSYDEKAFKSKIDEGFTIIDSLVNYMKRKNAKIEYTVSNMNIPSKVITSGIKQRELELKRYFTNKGISDSQLLSTGIKTSEVTIFKVISVDTSIAVETKVPQQTVINTQPESVQESVKEVKNIDPLRVNKNNTEDTISVYLNILYTDSGIKYKDNYNVIDSLKILLTQFQGYSIQANVTDNLINRKLKNYDRLYQNRKAAFQKELEKALNQKLKLIKGQSDSTYILIIKENIQPINELKVDTVTSIQSQVPSSLIPEVVEEIKPQIKPLDLASIQNSEGNSIQFILEYNKTNKIVSTLQLDVIAQYLKDNSAKGLIITITNQYNAKEYKQKNVIIDRKAEINNYLLKSGIKSTRFSIIDSSGQFNQLRVVEYDYKNDPDYIDYTSLLAKLPITLKQVEYEKGKSIFKRSYFSLDSLSVYLKNYDSLSITIPSSDITVKGKAKENLIKQRFNEFIKRIKVSFVKLDTVSFNSNSSFIEIDIFKNSPSEQPKVDSLIQEQGGIYFLNNLGRYYSNYDSLKNSRSDKIPDFVYFKKKFNFSGAIKDAQLVIFKDIPFDDDSTEIYINGRLIDRGNKFVYVAGSIKDLGAQFLPDSTYLKQRSEQQAIYMLTNDIQQGENIISLRVPGYIPSEGVKIALYVTYYGKVTDDQLKKLLKVVLEERKKSQEKFRQLELEQQSSEKEAKGENQ